MTYTVTPRNPAREAQLVKWFASGCEGKRSYSSQRWALIARDIAVRNGRASTRNCLSGTAPYRCCFCGEWHLGHSR